MNIRLARQVLGLSGDVSDRELRKKWRALATLHHPDRGGTSEGFHRVVEAYETMLEGDGQYDPDMERREAVQLSGPVVYKREQTWVSPYYHSEQRWMEEEFGHRSYWSEKGVPRHLSKKRRRSAIPFQGVLK